MSPLNSYNSIVLKFIRCYCCLILSFVVPTAVVKQRVKFHGLHVYVPYPVPPVPATGCVHPELTWPHLAAISWDSGSRPGLWRSSASVPHSAGILSPRLQSHIAIGQQEVHDPYTLHVRLTTSWLLMDLFIIVSGLFCLNYLRETICKGFVVAR